MDRTSSSDKRRTTCCDEVVEAAADDRDDDGEVRTCEWVTAAEEEVLRVISATAVLGRLWVLVVDIDIRSLPLVLVSKSEDEEDDCVVDKEKDAGGWEETDVTRRWCVDMIIRGVQFLGTKPTLVVAATARRVYTNRCCPCFGLLDKQPLY